MGPASLAGQNNIALSEAQKLIDTFMTSFCGVAHFIRQTISSAEEAGLVRTISGRPRLLNDLKTSPKKTDERDSSKCPSPWKLEKILVKNPPPNTAQTASHAKVCLI